MTRSARKMPSRAFQAAMLEETPGLREAVATGANSFVSEGVRYVIANGTVVTVKTADMKHLPMTDERRAQNGQG